MKKILLLGPSRQAVSGVSTHLNQLWGCGLAEGWTLLHFQVGSEGRKEGGAAKLWRLLASPLALARTILRDQPDVVHINTSMNAKSFWRDLAYLAVSRLCGRKVVYQVHGGKLPRDFLIAPLRPFLQLALRAATATVLLARIEMRAYSEFCPAGRYVLIPNAIDARRKLAIVREPHAEPLKLLYFGRLVRSKGLSESMAALKSARERGHPMQLTVAGSGPHLRYFQREQANLGLQEAVRFVGPVFGDAKIDLWRSHDIFIFPTNLTEGLPYALLEAMASATVPVCTAMGGMADVMRNGVHGVVVPNHDVDALADALIELDADRDTLIRLGRQAQERIRSTYTVDNLREAFDTLYRQVLAPATPRNV